MKKNNSFGSGLVYAVVAIVFTSVLAISCQKNSLEIEEKTNETYRQKEIAKFINKIEERGDNQSGQIIIHNASKKPSEEIYFENYNDLTDILNPIIEKLSVGATATTTLTEDDGPHGHADCKYCSKLGGLEWEFLQIL